MKERLKKSQYESTKDYTKNYNKLNINVQLNRELIYSLKNKLNGSSLKNFIEELIIKNDGFDEGFSQGQPKWISVETPPEHDNSVLVKSKDYRRPQDDVIDIHLGYFENGEWWYNESDCKIDSGLGWHAIEWMKIPL